MKKIVTLFTISTFISTFLMAQKSCDWSKLSTATQTTASVQPDDMVLDVQESVYQIGTYQTTMSIGGQTVSGTNGKYSTFLVKYSPTGLVSWFKTFVTEGNAPLPQNISIAVENGKTYIYVSGRYRTSIDIDGTKLQATFTSDNYLAKMDSNGKLIWAKTFISSSFFLNDMTVSANGNVIMGGQFFGSLQYETTILNSAIQKGYKSVLLCVAPDGKYLWSNIQTSAGTAASLSCLKTDKQNNIYVGGSYADTLVFDTKKAISNNPIGAAKKPWIAKFSSNGTCQWVKGATGGLVGNNTNSTINAILPDSKGDVYVTGQVWNIFDWAGRALQGNSKGKTMDPFLGKFDTNGNLVWLKGEGGFASQGNENGVGICFGINETPIFVVNIDSTQTWSNGKTYQTVGNSQDIAYVICNPLNGQYSSIETQGDIGVEYAISAIGNTQKMMIGGQTAGKSKFGSTVYNNSTSNKGEVFVFAKCVPTGVAQQDIFDDQISIFPNPFYDNIEIQNTDNQLFKYSKIKIFNNNGQLILQQDIDEESGRISIETAGIPNGMYLLEIQNGEKSVTKKIIKTSF